MAVVAGGFIEKPVKIEDVIFFKDAVFVKIAGRQCKERRRRPFTRLEADRPPHTVIQVYLGIERQIAG